jgi:putative phosphoribosyl transferase
LSDKANRDVKIPSGKSIINGNLEIPEGSEGIVVFAHGSGSSRFSPRNNYVAKLMNKSSLATLLIDLLTSEEEAADIYSGKYRFDVDLLAERLIDSTAWLEQNSSTKRLKVGYFGSSTGAAAALIADAKQPAGIKAIVSRGGRPDLAKENLVNVMAPTLLIVGGNDLEVLELNRQALQIIKVTKELKIVPGATHLFEEPGKLDEVANLAITWFVKYL